MDSIMGAKQLGRLPNRVTRGEEPVYIRLQKTLRRQIESGQWSPGQRIPPEREIAEKYGFSLGTVRTALLNLVSDGFLYRYQGRGTFVAGTDMNPEHRRYYGMAGEFHAKETRLRIGFLDLSTLPGTERINRSLKIREEEELIRLRRLVTGPICPLIYCVSYFPRSEFAPIEELPPSRFEKIPLYLLFENLFGLPTLGNRELICAVAAAAPVAEMLEIEKGEPVLSVEMLSFTYRKRIYEYRESYCLTRDVKIVRQY
jgi:GntR family transcriptional regulator